MTDDIRATYRLAAEFFVHPDHRDRERIEDLRESLEDAPDVLRGPLEEFAESDKGWSAEEYVQTLELSPPCPLYVGAYMYDEPGTCRGAGVSDRNSYLVELTNLYRHFGFEAVDRELPDFLPIMLEFLALTTQVDDLRDVAIRRYLVDEQFRPGLEPFQKKLEEYESVYAPLLDAIDAAVEMDWKSMPEVPKWTPPEEDDAPRPQMSCGQRLCSGPSQPSTIRSISHE